VTTVKIVGFEKGITTRSMSAWGSATHQDRETDSRQGQDPSAEDRGSRFDSSSHMAAGIRGRGAFGRGVASGRLLAAAALAISMTNWLGGKAGPVLEDKGNLTRHEYLQFEDKG